MPVIKILTRIYVEDLEETLGFYENVLGVKAIKYYSKDVYGLEMAEIGSFLLVAGLESELRFVRRIFATAFVDSLDGVKQLLLKQGAKILRDIQPGMQGTNMLVRHPDGLVIEYFQEQRG